MAHDFEAQREETILVWNDLSTRQKIPKAAVLDLQFVPTKDSAEREAFETELSRAGYTCVRYQDEEGETFEASIGPIELDADTIWRHELATTVIAIECGFKPDGWGFIVN